MIRSRWVLAALVAVPITIVGYMYLLAVSDPVVRRTAIAMPDWPIDAPPLRVALVSDIHVAGPDMPPSRVSRIVVQINRLKPDVVLLAGDFVSDKKVKTKAYSAPEGLAPLAALQARKGAFAVLGNHDHWRNAGKVRSALRRANIRILNNEAATVGGMRLGGVDDDYTGNADLEATVTDMRNDRGSRVLLSHTPDVAPDTPHDVTLILAGHTHCGQIRLPLIGPIAYVTKYGERYNCGLRIEASRRVIVTAGVGTSVLPLRFGVRPDLWLLTLGPPAN